ncbi:MAG: hypothetical protein ACFFDB_07670 [Promethearchaeota archaeon]
MKKGPVCYVYYAIKKKRQLKLEQEESIPKIKSTTFSNEVSINHY